MSSFFISQGVKILGLSASVPKNVIDVDYFKKSFGEDVVNKFKKNTGIYSMHRTSSEQTAGDLGYVAAQNLITKMGVDKRDIGVIIFVSQSPDYRRPATSYVLHKRLGLKKDCAAFDVNLGCSGFIYGNQIMTSLMSNSDVKYGLLIVAETSSKLVDDHDKSISMIFGDAGAAVLYGKDSSTQNITLLKADGDSFKDIIAPAGGFRDIKPDIEEYVDKDGNIRSKYLIYMDGISVFEFSITEVPVAIKEYLSYTEKTFDDFDYLVLHQANKMILKQLARKFHLDMKKIPISLDVYGNTSGVSIPLTICKNFSQCQNENINLLSVGFGTGLSWGVTAFNINTSNIYPVIESDECYLEGKF